MDQDGINDIKKPTSHEVIDQKKNENKSVKKIMKKKRRIIIAISVFLIIFFIVPFGLTIYIYQTNSIFTNRFETASWRRRSPDEFDQLNMKKFTFPSNDGQLLTGYKYDKEKISTKGIIVMAHGLGGGGHIGYMDMADFFAANGYVVFAYDATGNDESEGDAVHGLPQGIIDLDYAVQFVKNSGEFDSLPIMLFGHSWGAYAAGSVLNIHPDIKAVVMFSAFNQSTDMIEEEGERILGSGIKLLIPYVTVFERMKFGNYAAYNCIKGFEKSDAGGMFIHSRDDSQNSYEKQFERFSHTFQDDPRFVFISFEDREHNYVYYSDASRDYQNEFNKGFTEHINALDTELTNEIYSAYIDENFDKTKFFDLDIELLDEIVSFYDNYAVSMNEKAS